MDSPLERKFLTAFLLLIAAQLIIWTLLPILILKGTYVDILENLSWGRHWDWGYDKNPYFGAWITRWFYEISKQGIWTAYLLSQLAIVFSYYGVWRLARYIVSSRAYAFISVSLLITIPFYNLISPEFNDNVLEIALWPLMCLYFYEALRWQKLHSWILLGIVSGLALMSKYYTAALLLPMFIFLLATREGRESFRKIGFYLALIIFLILIIPNLVWLYNHNFISIHYALGRAQLKPALLTSIYTRIYHSVMFILGLIIRLALFFLVVFLYFFPKRTTGKFNNFDWWFLLTVSFGPILLSLLFCLITGGKYNVTWQAPLFSFFGVLAVAWLQPTIDLKVFRNYSIIISCIFIFWVLIYLIMEMIYPYTRTDLWHMYETFPGKTLSADLTQQWQAKYHRPVPYVAGTRLIAVNVEVFSKDHPVSFFEWNPNFSAWINEDDLRKQGAIFVWQITDDRTGLPGDIEKEYPTAKLQPMQTYDWAINPLFKKLFHFENPPPLQIGVAFLPPKN